MSDFQIKRFTKQHPIIMAIAVIIAASLDIAIFAVPCYIIISNCFGFGFAAEIEMPKAIALAVISAFGLCGAKGLFSNLVGAVIQNSR